MAYLPSLTLPPVFFTSPLLAIGFPVSLGLGSGLIFQPGGNKPKIPSDKSTELDRVKKQYKALKQPPGNPPPYIFAPVWTGLYGLMGYASYRAWTLGMASASPRTVENARRGATLYTIQLVLNQLFMPLFFRFGQPAPALADITVLTGTVGYLIYIWRQVDKTAAYCLVPYLAWLSFATYLTAGAGYLNGWNTKRVNEELVEDKKAL
jgi:translocator protein